MQVIKGQACMIGLGANESYWREVIVVEEIVCKVKDKSD